MISPVPSRRSFLKTSAAATATLGTLSLARGAHAAGSDVLKIGLIGCGGRGTGAANDALGADPAVKLWALGDAFPERIESSLNNLRKQKPEKIDVTPERCFVGLDSYQKVIDSGVDVVLLCTPPHFRPKHFAAAVAAGKHVFAEKPVAVDAPGCRAVLATVEEARKKKLSVVSGLCYRYDQPKRDLMKLVHDGQIGRIVAIHTTYNTGSLWMHPRKAEWSDFEWQLRNWLYFTWLSGDHNVEQHVHSLDKAAWALGDKTPVRAWGLGGRQVRTDPAFGHIYDHHAVCYEYEDGVKVFAYCRQQAGASTEVSDFILGTEGTADVMRHAIKRPDGETLWRHRGPGGDMYQQEHDELFASIRSGEPINNGDYMVKSSMLAIFGRMVNYTGQTLSWDQAWNSTEDLTPPSYDFGPLPVPPIAMPGVTKFA
jgi:predicted dehydrogenase